MKGEKIMTKADVIEKIKNNKKAVIIGGCVALLVIGSIVSVIKLGGGHQNNNAQVVNEGSSNINSSKKNISATQDTTEIEDSVNSDNGDITEIDKDQEANQDTKNEIDSVNVANEPEVSEESIAIASGSTGTVYSSAESNNEEVAPAGRSESEDYANDSNQNNSAGRSAEPEKVWHDAVYENQYVVDSAAWDETIEEPVYDMQERTICNTCGADITGNTYAHSKQHALNGENDAYHCEMVKVQTGTTTRTIHHDETGHYESVCVHDGYWE